MRPGEVCIAEGFGKWPHFDALIDDLVRQGIPFSSRRPGDFVCFTGRFDAHWESDDGRKFRPGPDKGSVEEAIKWGRSQADVVWLRVGNGDLGGDEDGYFSAGTRHPDPDTPVWPDEGIKVEARPYEGPWRAGVDWFEIGGGSATADD
jgi:hypothetical protein